MNFVDLTPISEIYMAIRVRKMKPRDISYLLDIELKCFEDNVGLDGLLEYIEAQCCQVFIVTVDEAVAGYIMWSNNHIVRFAVKPRYRTLGAGSLLIYCLEQSLIEYTNSDRVTVNIPESLCCPSSSEDISKWLLNRGFQACRIIPKAVKVLGKEEDAYQFVKLIC